MRPVLALIPALLSVACRREVPAPTVTPVDEAAAAAFAKDVEATLAPCDETRFKALIDYDTLSRIALTGVRVPPRFLEGFLNGVKSTGVAGLCGNEQRSVSYPAPSLPDVAPDPARPAAALDTLGPGLWQAVGEIHLPGRVCLPLRATIVRLTDGGLVVISPIAFAAAQAAAIDALGPVRHLVAPSKLHHLHLPAAVARWPGATVHGAPGLAGKRPDVTFTHELGDQPDPAWQDVLAPHVVRGAPRLDEVVFFHRATGTLIVTDLLFHVRRPTTLATRLLLALVGTGRRLAQSRAWRLFVKDRAAARRSAAHLLDWPITGIAFAHGDPWHGDGRALLRTALVRMTGRGGVPALPAGSRA